MKALNAKRYVYVGMFALLVSLIFVAPFLLKGKLVYGDDLEYQLSRIKELAGWLNDGQYSFPGMSTRSFYSLGYGVNLFYPWLTLVPFAIACLVIKNPFAAVYLGFYFYTVVTVLIAYYSMKKYSRSWVAGAAFSILYTFSNYRTIDGITRFALAEFIALTFLPLLLLGSYEVLFGQKRYWVLVTISFSLILFTHVLSAFLACIYLVLFWGMSLIFIDERIKRSLVLLFSGFVAIFASAGYLFPFIEEQTFQSFLQPSPMVLAGTDIWKLFFTSLSNDLVQGSRGGTYNIGFICIVILFIGGFFWTSFTTNYKTIYVLGVFTLFMTTDLFPWSIMQKTPIVVIQFPFRLLVFPTIFACITGANVVKILSEKYSRKKQMGTLSLMLFLCLVPWLISLNSMLAQAYSFDFNTGDIYFRDSTNRFIMWIDQYMPEASQKYVDEIYQHVGYLEDNTFVAKPKNDKQSLILDVSIKSNQTDIDLPVIRYKNTAVFVNGEKVPIKSSYRGTIQFVANKGLNRIRIEYLSSKIIKIGIFLSTVTWIIVMLYLFEVIIKNKKGKLFARIHFFSDAAMNRK